MSYDAVKKLVMNEVATMADEDVKTNQNIIEFVACHNITKFFIIIMKYCK